VLLLALVAVPGSGGAGDHKLADVIDVDDGRARLLAAQTLRGGALSYGGSTGQD